MAGDNVEKEIAALRQEVYEARGLIIKSDNLLRNLHAELKAIAKKQQEAERRHFVGHVVSLILFAVLAGAGAYLATTLAVAAERASATKALEAARKAAEEAKAREAEVVAEEKAREEAVQRALALWRRLESEDPAEREAALEEAAALDLAKAGPLAEEAVGRRVRQLLEARARAAWERGREAFKKQQMKEAAEALDAFFAAAKGLSPNWEKETRAQASYYLGVARNQLGDDEAAVSYLRAYVETGGPRSSVAYAYLLLGDSLEALGRKEEAAAAYEAGLRVESTGATAANLRRRLEKLRAK
ncbi:MAG: hypothetical protein D6729_10170 [Deltaproteobacteria bacterium]|nr:MAG: hypothetical protein D6729_10170 [Deltaproteobacteria bacterium]